MKRLVFFLLPWVALAQYQPVPGTQYPALENILNGKPAIQSGLAVPTSACTSGKDLYVRTVGPVLYVCGPSGWAAMAPTDSPTFAGNLTVGATVLPVGAPAGSVAFEGKLYGDQNLGTLEYINTWKLRNATIAIGDSITSAGEAETYWPEGWYSFATFLSKGLAYHYANAGVSGQTTSQMLARFGQDVIAYSPAFVVILGGTNDIPYTVGTPTLTVAQIAANIEAMIQQAQAYGSRVMVGTVPPNSGSAQCAANACLANITALNTLITGLCATYGATCVDFHAALAESDGTWKTGYSDDGVHPNKVGKKEAAQAWVTAATPLYYGKSWLPSKALEANNMVYGSLMSDTGSGTAGVPLGFTTVAPSSGTAAYSIVADSSIVGNWARGVFSAATNAYFLRHDYYNFKAGDVLAIACRARISGAESGTFTAKLHLSFLGAGTYADPISDWTRDLDGTVYFEITIPAGTTGMQTYWLINGTGTLDVAQYGILNLTSLASGVVRQNISQSKSEPELADLVLTSAGTTQASFTENSLTNGVQFPTGTGTDYAYWGANAVANTPYTASFYVVADDGNAVTTADMKCRINATTVVVVGVRKVSGSLYRATCTTVTTGASPDTNAWGVWRDSGNSGRAFRVTGFQVNVGIAPLPYEKLPRT